MRRKIESKIQRGAQKAKRSVKKAKTSVKKAQSTIQKSRKDIDEKLLELASKSMDKITDEIQEKTTLDIRGDIPKQLAQKILSKAAKVREAVHYDDIVKSGNKAKEKVTKVVVSKRKSKKSIKPETPASH